MRSRIGIVGSFDSKGPEYAFLREQLLGLGAEVVAIDTGILGATAPFPVDVAATEIIAAAGGDLAALRTARDRGAAMQAAAAGLAAALPGIVARHALTGVIGLGGTGGTSVVTAGMRALPLGFPKLCVSTAAAGNVSAYVGTRDIAMMHSVVDISGINRISRVILTRAAGAIHGMAQAVPRPAGEDRPVIAASMFGNTTECVTACSQALHAAGYEVLVFHATGAGGRTMEALVDDGVVDAVLDITTTEWADQVAGGVFDAGPDRLAAPGRRGIPHLVSNGCIDMVNFGPRATVPAKYADRLLYEWNPSVTLMRTNIEENRRMGRAFAEKANAAIGPVAFLLATGGVSILDGDGQPFCDRAADAAFADELKSHLSPDIEVRELPVNINSREFSDAAVAWLLELTAAHAATRGR